MKIIFLSNQLFDFPLKTNKWHVATRVAERGHEVLFVDPPIRLRKLVKQVFERRWTLKRLLTGFYKAMVEFCSNRVQPSGASGGLNPIVLKQAQNDGQSLIIFTPFTFSISESPNLVEFNLRRMKKRFPGFFDGEAVLWVYNPAVIEYVEKIPHRLLVYDCVDDYPSMANYARLNLSEEIARREGEIATRADVVFTTTRGLARKLSRYNNNVQYVGNAGDYDRFAPVGKLRLSRFDREKGPKEKGQALKAPGLGSRIPSEPSPKSLALGNSDSFPRPVLSSIPRPRIGFTGAIDEYKLNLPLLAKVAKTYPDYSLVLVGPQGVADSQPNLSELKKLPSVCFLGSRPYDEMPAFFAGFDCYIIPYNLNDYTLRGCFPVKFFDALAAGLPTVVSNLPDYEPFADVCYIAKSDEEFSKAIQIALEEDSPEKIQARMRIARENSWGRKVDKMLEIVSNC